MICLPRVWWCVMAMASIGAFALLLDADRCNAADPKHAEAETADHDHADKAHTAGDHAAGDHAAHDHIGAANLSPSLESPAEVKADLALFTFVVFLILLGVLWKFAWGPIAAGLETREHLIGEHIASVERAHEEAKRMLAEHERQLAGTADQIREMLEEARRDAEHTKTEIVAEAQAAAETERKRALRDIDAATSQALKALAEHSANLAVELAGKIVRSKLTGDEQSKLIQEAMARFPQSPPGEN
jgi:F-type H+-transporting ATPase subunit b